MRNEKALGKIYDNLDMLLDHYDDLPETVEAEQKFWEYARKYILENREQINKIDLECVLYDVASFNEKQGFLYGFNYALELLGKSE